MHPADLSPAARIARDYSLEVLTKDTAALAKSAQPMAPGSALFIPYLPGDGDDARVAAAVAVRQLGMEPVPHISARRVPSPDALASLLARLVAQAGVQRCFVIGGDASPPVGPFADSLSLIESGALEGSGIRRVGVGGHPEGHPIMNASARWRVLEQKCEAIGARGMAPSIVTQFAFDADVVLAWLSSLRERGIDHPVRIGVPGPAGVATLARYAARCGVSACASAWSKYGISIGKLLAPVGPDRFVDALVQGLTPAHGIVNLHLFPFGGIAQSVAWMQQYAKRLDAQTD